MWLSKDMARTFGNNIEMEVNTGKGKANEGFACG